MVIIFSNTNYNKIQIIYSNAQILTSIRVFNFLNIYFFLNKKNKYFVFIYIKSKDLEVMF